MEDLLGMQVQLAKRLREATTSAAAAESARDKLCAVRDELESLLLATTMDLVGTLSLRRAPAEPPPLPGRCASSPSQQLLPPLAPPPTPERPPAQDSAAAALAAFLCANEACYTLLRRLGGVSLAGALVKAVELSEEERKAIGHVAVMALAQLHAITE